MTTRDHLVIAIGVGGLGVVGLIILIGVEAFLIGILAIAVAAVIVVVLARWLISKGVVADRRRRGSPPPA